VAAYAPRYEVTLSLVSVLGAGGVQQMHEPAMTADERAALERSAAALREAAAEGGRAHDGPDTMAGRRWW
jgi:L-lactate dehydrogenase